MRSTIGLSPRVIFRAANWIDVILRIIGVFESNSPIPADKGTVIVLLFHKFIVERSDRASFYAPFEAVTVQEFEETIRFFSERGYQFLLPRDLLCDAHLGRRSVIITVDDGYASFLLSLGILERYLAKAALFVSAANVQQQQPYWSDVLKRGATSRGWSKRVTRRVQAQLRAEPHDIAHLRLEALFSAKEVRQVDPDLRPLTPDELGAIAALPNVEVGNHSFDHVTLAHRPEAYVREQIETSQAALEEMIGYHPTSIAYPNGRWDPALIALCREYGFRTGFLSAPARERIGPAAHWHDRLNLARIEIRGGFDPVRQALSAEMPISASRTAVALKAQMDRLTEGVTARAWRSSSQAAVTDRPCEGVSDERN